jgi:nicotinamidase/pyrazinamidase
MNALTKINPRTDVLVATDVQLDFCPGGALEVADGHDVVPAINFLSPYFTHLVASQDWHTPGHMSFASSHPGRRPFETIEVAYGPQTLWPDHCVQGTAGAEMHPELDLTAAGLIIRKGFDREIDSYSAFFENDKTTPTGLAGYLRERGIKRCFFAGLATDFCVAYSALDARSHGFESFVIIDACRAIDLNGSLAASLKRMEESGVAIVESRDLI